MNRLPMSVIKTSPVVDDPRVLLIGAETWLISKVSLLFAGHQIDTMAISAEDFLRVDPDKIDTDSVYKILWWVDFKNIQAQENILKQLIKFQNKLVILGELPHQLASQDVIINDNFQVESQFFEELSSTLSGAQLFFAKDLLTEQDLPTLLQFAMRGINQRALLDPELRWFPIDISGFFNVISPYLIRPHKPHRVLSRGRGRMTTKDLQKLADFLKRYFQENWDVIPVNAQTSYSPAVGFVETGMPVEVEKILDKYARQRETWRDILKSSLPASSLPTLLAKKEERKSPITTKDQPVKTVTSENQVTQVRQNEKKRLINQLKSTNSAGEEEKIEGEVERIFSTEREEKKEKRIDDRVKIIKKVAKKSQKNKALFYGGVVTMSLGGLVLLLWGFFAATTALAKKEIVAAFSQISTNAQREFTPGTWLSVLSAQNDLYQPIIGEELLGEGKEVADFGNSLVALDKNHKQLSLLTTQYFLGILGLGESSPVFPPDLTDQIKNTQQAIGDTLQKTAAVSLSDSPTTDWQENLRQSQQELALISQFPDLFTDLFGGNGKRTYAVLLQNNLELRPTGGFVQAVAFLVFDKGILVDSQVVSVYEIDNRLPGSVIAPAEIQKYLGESSWYLRDSNWNPDFPETASQATWFLREATGFQVDGVWAINYAALQDLLAATGPLEMPSYDEVLTKDNLLERVEFHSDDELATGQDKKEYAVAVFSQFLQKLQTLSPEDAPLVLEALGQSLAKKEILVSLTDAKQNESLSKLEWNGEIINPTCPTQFSSHDCVVDQIYQVESNIGLNRVNDYVRRNIKHSVDVVGDKFHHTRTVTLENTTRSQGWPLGTYKAYIRFILDGEAQPISVTVDGKKLGGDAVRIYGEEGRKVLGVPVEVTPQSTVTLEISYTTEKIPSGPYSFMLFDQKQPGLEDTGVTIDFHHEGKKATVIAPAAQVYGNSLEWQMTQDGNLFVGASFQ